MSTHQPRTILKIAIALAIAGSSVSAFAGGPPPKWRALADCAAAYRANSRIPDPNRAGSMAAMISDQADDYQKAAQKAYGHDPAAAKQGGSYAKTFVSTYVERRSAAFSKRPRADIEHFIDACPQPDAWSPEESP